MRKSHVAYGLTVLASLAMVAGQAHATTLQVNAKDSIYNYNGIVAGPSSLPAQWTSLTPGGNRILTFSSVTGSVTLDLGVHPAWVNADGIGSAAANNQPGVIGAGGLSSIVAPHAGYLAGVFLNGAEAAAAHITPGSLNFDTLGTSFAQLAPSDDQVFYIGDGLTGNGTGAQQQFIVPADATVLVLGIVDGHFYNGRPTDYGDNAGTFTASFSIADPLAIPEPAAYALAGLGIAALGLIARRKRS